jgi:hypothetical protein
MIRKNGLGDITLLVNYKLYQKTKMNIAKRSAVSHEVWFGGGFKLPTGKYHFDMENPESNLGDVNSQMGTGSLDFMVNGSYNLRINKVGINTSVDYKINTTNSNHFNFGNRFTANTFGYYALSIKGVSVAPNAGVLYEYAAVNHYNDQKVDLTGGSLALGVTGVEFAYKKMSVGGNLQIPFAQDFAEGQTVAKTRGMVHVTYSF